MPATTFMGHFGTEGWLIEMVAGTFSGRDQWAPTIGRAGTGSVTIQPEGFVRLM